MVLFFVHQIVPQSYQDSVFCNVQGRLEQRPLPCGLRREALCFDRGGVIFMLST